MDSQSVLHEEVQFRFVFVQIWRSIVYFFDKKMEETSMHKVQVVEELTQSMILIPKLVFKSMDSPPIVCDYANGALFLFFPLFHAIFELNFVIIGFVSELLWYLFSFLDFRHLCRVSTGQNSIS
jgi:hypothetical protein